MVLTFISLGVISFMLFPPQAKYRAPVAIYCGRIPQAKPGCRALRRGGMDSSLQLHGNGWVPANDGEDAVNLGVLSELS